MSIKSIFVVCDNAGTLNELCSGAKTLADKVTAVVFGDESFAKELASCGADKILFCPGKEFAPDSYAKAVAEEIKAEESAFVMLCNSIIGRSLAGKLSALLDTAALTNVTELVPQDNTLLCRHMVYGGAAERLVRFTTPYAVVTMGSGAFEVKAGLAPCGDISPIKGQPDGGIKRISLSEKKESVTNLATAKRIVDIGRGLAAEEDLEMIRKLASVLEADLGCSRPVAENNKWLPKSCYMGVTGVQVKPELCLSMAVSGQIQHIAGINKSKVIVAVNKDKEAPIFKNADFGLVGDIYKVVPALIEKLS